MKPTLKNDLLLRAARREPVERAPVWFMRQAGRYLPEYRAIRSKHDFLTMVKTPELASEVTIQPVDIVGVDAAIIFSDILTVPEAMGMKLLVEEGKGGPKFPDPIRSYSQIKNLHEIDATKDLAYVGDAIKLTVEKLNGRVPLIGFSGAPWTLFCYMVEGQGSKDFKHAKELIFSRDDDAHKLLGKLADAVTDYLVMQIEAGADIVQIFDTWAGILTPEDFEDFSLQYIARIVRDVKQRTNNRAPIIVFCKGANQTLTEISYTGCDVIGLDWTIDIAEVKGLFDGAIGLQGNLDPTLLYAPDHVIEDRVFSIAQKMGDPTGHIFNLGHGISPDVQVDKVKTFINAAKNAYQR
jgi:uroporphyrinogen decarboxylase